MPDYLIHHLGHPFLSIEDFANLYLDSHSRQCFLCFVLGGCPMVLDWWSAAELALVGAWLKRSIVFHIHMVEVSDYNMCLIRCLGSKVWFWALRISGDHRLLVVDISLVQTALADWKAFHLSVEANWPNNLKYWEKSQYWAKLICQITKISDPEEHHRARCCWKCLKASLKPRFGWMNLLLLNSTFQGLDWQAFLWHIYSLAGLSKVHCF